VFQMFCRILKCTPPFISGASVRGETNGLATPVLGVGFQWQTRVSKCRSSKCRSRKCSMDSGSTATLGAYSPDHGDVE
jgi:hypothetical protein